MARVEHSNITTTWTQIATVNAQIILQKVGKGTIYINESADDSTASAFHSTTTNPGKSLQQTAGKPTFIKASEADSGWNILVSEV